MRIVGVDADDHVRANQLKPLNHVEADAAEAEDDGIRARLDLGRVDHGADAGRHAAADIADRVEGRVFPDLGKGDLGHDRVIGEGRGAHIVEDLLAAGGEPAGAVGHQTLALRDADFLAEIGLAGGAIFAFAAFRRVERDDVIARLQRGDARPAFDNDPGAFMAENGGKDALRVGARKRELVGVANAGRLDLDQAFPLARRREIDGRNLQWLSSRHRNCCPRLHRNPP